MKFIDQLCRLKLKKEVKYLLLVVISIRIISIFIMGPMPQDAYYFFYAQHPSLSYFDHPPAIAYLLWLFTTVFGHHVIAIKLAVTSLTILTCLSVYQLALKFLGEKERIKAIVLFLSSLMVSILSLISTPDTPLLFFWALSLLALYEAIFKERKLFWLLAGFLMGLAFDSKYTAVFLPAGMILFLLFSAKHRKYLFTIWPWLSGFLMILTSAPVIIWNVNNHFASFAFQGSQRMHDAAAFSIKPTLFLGLIGHQLALLIPVFFITVILSVYQLIKKYAINLKQMPDKHIFLLCFFLPLFLTFLCLSPIYWVKINWMMPAYITGTLLAATLINGKWLRIQLYLSAVVHLALLVEVLFYPFPIKSDDTWVGWADLSKQVFEVKARQKADFIFSADNYKTSAALNLYTKNLVYGQNVIGLNALQFDFIGTNLTLLAGKDAIYVDSDRDFKDSKINPVPPTLVLPFFKSVTQLKPILIYFMGRPVRKFYIYLCKGYRPPMQKPLF